METAREQLKKSLFVKVRAMTDCREQLGNYYKHRDLLHSGHFQKGDVEEMMCEEKCMRYEIDCYDYEILYEIDWEELT